MTGNDILKEEFERAGMRGGYRADQVDTFLKIVAKYVDDTNTKNEDLSYKLKILADKIEEYKRDESSIRDALLGAQKLGSSVIEEANQKAEAITRESRMAAEDMLAQAKAKIESLTKDSLQRANSEIAALRRECEREQRHLDSMKVEVSSFRSSVLKQYKNHLDLLSNLPSVDQSTQTAQATQSAEPVEKNETTESLVQADTIKDELREHIRHNTSQLKAVGIREAQHAQPVSSTFSKIVDLNINVQNTQPLEKVSLVKETPQKTSTVGPIGGAETIKTDILPVEEDMKQEVKLQTKEFNSSRKPAISANEMNDRGNVSPAVPFNPPKKNSMATKFAELDFGKNNE